MHEAYFIILGWFQEHNRNSCSNLLVETLKTLSPQAVAFFDSRVEQIQ